MLPKFNYVDIAPHKRLSKYVVTVCDPDGNNVDTSAFRFFAIDRDAAWRMAEWGFRQDDKVIVSVDEEFN